jgi:polyhydroxyalkanoate synthesis regulator phasin
MNPENLIDLLQKSFRVTLGATASLVETLQDPQKRQENVSKLQSEWSQLADEWAEKGSITEQEARQFVDSFLAQRGKSTPSTNDFASQPSDPIPTTAVPVPDSDVQADLQELTAQITALREELESLKES